MSEEIYQLHAFGSPDTFDLKSVRAQFSESPIRRFGPECLQIALKEKSLLYVFRYGSLVFVNTPLKERESLLEILELADSLTASSSQSEDLIDDVEDDFQLRITADASSVSFNSVTIPEWNEDWIQVIAEVMAKSAALEVLENEAQSHVQMSEELLAKFKKRRYFVRRNEILQSLSDAMAVRHKMVNQLLLLQHPDLVWEDESLHKIYNQLVDNFDLHIRMQGVEKLLEDAGRVSELILAVLDTRRSEFLEIVIIVLIAVEIVQTVIDQFA